MNIFIPFICSVFVFGYSFCSGALVNPALIRPDSSEVLKQSDSPAAGLKILLDEKQNNKFYRKAYESLQLINTWKKENEPISKEKKANAMWIFYMVSNAPFLASLSPDEAKGEEVNSGQDIETKEYLMGMFMHPSFDLFFSEGIKFKNMRVSYATLLLKEMRAAAKGLPDADTISYNTIGSEKELMNAHSARIAEICKKSAALIPAKFEISEWRYAEEHPDDKIAVDKVNEKLRLIRQWGDQVDKAQKEEWDGTMEKRNFLLEKARRDKRIARALPRMEKNYMVMLVRLYPDKAAEVKKWLKEAGYTNQEIYDLIDHTVGRTSKTEFLYKGANRKRAL